MTEARKNRTVGKSYKLSQIFRFYILRLSLSFDCLVVSKCVYMHTRVCVFLYMFKHKLFPQSCHCSLCVIDLGFCILMQVTKSHLSSCKCQFVSLSDFNLVICINSTLKLKILIESAEMLPLKEHLLCSFKLFTWSMKFQYTLTFYFKSVNKHKDIPSSSSCF